MGEDHHLPVLDKQNCLQGEATGPRSQPERGGVGAEMLTQGLSWSVPLEGPQRVTGQGQPSQTPPGWCGGVQSPYSPGAC